jgi:CRP-like cAMP-binding protein
MNQQLNVATPEGPKCDPTALDDLLTGSRIIRDAFLKTTLRFAGRDTKLISSGVTNPSVILIRSGFAVRSCTMPNGRRAIFDLFIPGDLCGLFHLFTKYPIEEITAVNRVAYHSLDASAVRALFTQGKTGLSILAWMTDAHYRVERLTAAIGRLDAHGRVCVLLLDAYDRLRHRKLIDGNSFSLPLTQEEMADFLGITLVHVNRTLRRLREEGLMVVERQVVSIEEPDRLRQLVSGLPCGMELPEPALPAEPHPGMISAQSRYEAALTNAE